MDNEPPPTQSASGVGKGSRPREHPPKNCSWRKRRACGCRCGETRRGKDRLKIQDLFARKRCSRAILDFLATTDVGRRGPNAEGEGTERNIGVGIQGAGAEDGEEAGGRRLGNRAAVLPHPIPPSARGGGASFGSFLSLFLCRLILRISPWCESRGGGRGEPQRAYRDRRWAGPA